MDIRRTGELLFKFFLLEKKKKHHRKTLLSKLDQCIKPDNSLKAHFIYIHEEVINLLFTIFIKKPLQVS